MNAISPFAFDGKSVRVVEINGTPWFVAADVCACLDIGNSRHALSRLDDDEKGVATDDTLGGRQEMSVVNEAGLYRLIFTSRKEQAERFKRWLAHEVLPAIRRHGHYQMNATGPLELEASKDETLYTPFYQPAAQVVMLSRREELIYRAVVDEARMLYGKAVACVVHNSSPLARYGRYDLDGDDDLPEIINPDWAVRADTAQLSTWLLSCRQVKQCTNKASARRQWESLPLPQFSWNGDPSPVGDGRACLAHLLATEMVSGITVRAQIDRAVSGSTARRSLFSRGIWVNPDGHPGMVAVCIKGKFLTFAYSGGVWNTDWSVALSTLPGAKPLELPVRWPDGYLRKVVLVPLSLIVGVEPVAAG